MLGTEQIYSLKPCFRHYTTGSYENVIQHLDTALSKVNIVVGDRLYKIIYKRKLKSCSEVLTIKDT